MLIGERHQAILDIIEKNKKITTAEIQRRFGISYDSAKRDLRILEERGCLKRTYGGAIELRRMVDGGEVEVASKQNEASEKHLAVARRAASLIGDGDVVFICDGEIGRLIAGSIGENTVARAVTNSISVAQALRSKHGVTVIMIGGELDSGGKCCDAVATDTVSRLRFDKCFITAEGISADFGLSGSNTSEIAFLSTVINRSKSVIGVFPGECIGREAVMSICPADKLNTLITDADAPDAELSRLRGACNSLEVLREAEENRQ